MASSRSICTSFSHQFFADDFADASVTGTSWNQMTMARIESSPRDLGMRFTRSQYAGSEVRPPFWRFFRRFKTPAPAHCQALFAAASAAVEYLACPIAQENPVKSMSKHTMTAFDTDLRTIRAEVIDMGERVWKSVQASIAVLAHRDRDLAAGGIEFDRVIDSRQREIETRVIETMARRQPLAVDLRELVGAFHIVSNLERIGDLAKNICKRV